MIAQADGDAAAVRGALLLAESDPLRAARTLFNGLKIQPRGGRQAVVRWIVEELLRHDPGGIAGVVADLEGIARRLAEQQGK